MYLARRTWLQDLKLALGVFAFVALLMAVTLVGLLWNSPGAQKQEASPPPVITRANFDAVFDDLPHADWQKLLYRITVVDFCGQLSWHVREGYRLDRNRLQARMPLSIADAAALRNQAIAMVEAQMNLGGAQDYALWCAGQGEAAAEHFRTAWVESRVSG
jgi:hypothetical protein